MTSMLEFVPRAWNAAGWAMLHVAWLATAIGIVAALCRRALSRSRPETRHAAACAFLLTLTILPLVTFAWLYEVQPTMPTTQTSIAVAAQSESPTFSTPVAWELWTRRVEKPGIGPQASAQLSWRFEPLVRFLPAVWLMGSLATLGLVATGLAGVQRLRRSCLPLERGAIVRQCHALARSLGVARNVGVAVSDRLVAPVLIGMFRPLIVFPSAALTGWSSELLEMAFLHELAHLKRFDDIVILVQRLAESLLFFHPVAWWVSRWVSIEREHCCDRLVVERTGRPVAYARLLATLAGAGPGFGVPALAMAERPILTRIRLILDMEDRSMKVTLNEGFGLVAAVVCVTLIALGARAEPPAKDEGPAEPARIALERLSSSIARMPESTDGSDQDGKPLLAIARAQLKLRDRAGSLATLRLIEVRAGKLSTQPAGKRERRAWQQLAAQLESVELLRDAGDAQGARRLLARLANDFAVIDTGIVRSGFDRISKVADEQFAQNPKARPVLTDDEEADQMSGIAVSMIGRCLEMGETELARTLARRVAATTGPPEGAVRSMIVSLLGAYLVKAGDAAAGRTLIDRGSAAIRALKEPRLREFALPKLARVLCEAGDLNGALALLSELPPGPQEEAVSAITGQLCTAESQPPVQMLLWGIDLTVGSPSLVPRDRDEARKVLPAIAAAVRAKCNAEVQARSLATIARLQAKAGDFAAALATAESIPALEQPTGRPGFTGCARPAAFALIAGLMDEAADHPGATAAFARAEGLALSVKADDQRLLGQLVIAQRQAAAGRNDAARAVVAGMLPSASTQPEPRRSRILTMMVEVQVTAGEIAGALRTADAIRDYPGLEKARAFTVLARSYTEVGDGTSATAMNRRAVACLDTTGPAARALSKANTNRAIQITGSTDYDVEPEPYLVNAERAMWVKDFRVQLGEVDQVLNTLKSLPPIARDFALTRIIGSIAQTGNVNRAIDLAATIESSEVRLGAMSMLATVLADKGATK